MKVLVTGAGGFLGNHVIQELLNRDIQVIASSINEEKIKSRPWFKKVKYISLDIDNIDTNTNYYEKLHSPDRLIHLAWQGLPNYEALFHFEKNLASQYCFLKNMIFNGLKDITVAGTCMEYGLQEGKLSEEDPVQPNTSYGFAKSTLYTGLELMHKQVEFSLKWARLFYMYGEGQNTNSLIPQLERAIKENQHSFNMSGGEQTRDYLPVEKVAEYLVTIALQNKIKGLINCCSGIPVKLKDFVENYLTVFNKKIELNTGYYPYSTYEPMHFWGDTNKLNQILNNE